MQAHQGACMATISQGVLSRLNAARSARSQRCCSLSGPKSAYWQEPEPQVYVPSTTMCAPAAYQPRFSVPTVRVSTDSARDACGNRLQGVLFNALRLKRVHLAGHDMHMFACSTVMANSELLSAYSSSHCWV